MHAHNNLNAEPYDYGNFEPPGEPMSANEKFGLGVAIMLTALFTGKWWAPWLESFF